MTMNEISSAARTLIKKLKLNPHPEGGLYRETYRCKDVISAAALPKRFKGNRSASTAILFLVVANKPSRLHRIASDEIWHFHTGDPLTIAVIHPTGRFEKIRLGDGNTWQAVVPAGCWFGAYLENGHHALVGCTVAPGFDFADFELADRNALSRRFPRHRKIINKLT